jgi:heme-degrading monooxygenase HmoA
MVAGMATFEGAPTAVPDTARQVREDLVPWLREYDGFRGVLVLTGEERHRVITIWDTREDEASSRSARLAMHDSVSAAVGMSLVDYECYEAPVCVVSR